MLGGAFLLLPLPGARGQPTAEFSTLTVKVSGSGKVTSSPAGINCPPTCEKTVATGTKITLTATPSAGYVFSKWTGSCAGTSKTCAVLMTANKNVFAWFVVAGRPPPPPPPPPPPKPPPPPGPGPPPPPAPPPPPPAGKPRCAKDVACFDDLTQGTFVRRHYVRMGLEVGYAPTIEKPGSVGAAPRVAVDGLARSGTQVGRIDACGKEFCPSATIYGRFAKPRKWVEVWVGGGAEVSLIARNASFNTIDGAAQTVQTASGSLSLLRVDSSSYNIAYFQLGENALAGSQRGGLTIDDLKAGEPDPNAKPDFALSWTPLLPAPTLEVPIPGQVTTKIAITRLNASAGDIRLSGYIQDNDDVTINLTPEQAGKTTTSAFVQLKTNADAVIPAKTKLYVIGKPGSDATGPGPRVVEIDLTGRLANYDAVVTGIEVTQGIQAQETPYYSGRHDPDECTENTEKPNEACKATLFDKNICADWPSLPARDMNDLSQPVHYGRDELSFDDDGFKQLITATPFAPPPQQTRGARLVAGRQTIVRVFASLVGSKGSRSIPAGQLRLHGRRNGKPISYYLTPEYSPSRIRGAEHAFVTCDQRADATAAYTFTLPPAWRDGKLELRAEFIPEEVIFGEGGECGSPTCAANNSLTLDGIRFTDLAYTTITPVAVMGSLVPGLMELPPPPGEVLAKARFHMPGRTFLTGDGASDSSYAGVLDVTGIIGTRALKFLAEDAEELGKMRCGVILDELEDWGDDHSHGDQTIAIFNKSDELCGGKSDSGYKLLDDAETYATVRADLKDSMAHELFHGAGRPHSDISCGGDSNGQTGEEWPPDQRGQIHGFGLDWLTPRQGEKRTKLGPYRIIVPDAVTAVDDPKQPEEWLDLMSYCHDNHKNRWQSVRGWNDMVRLLRRFHEQRGRLLASAAARAAGPPVLHVSALATPRGALITTVKTGPGSGSRAGSLSPYRLLVRGNDGRVLGSTTLRFASSEDDPEIGLLRGAGPARGAAVVEIVRDGRVVAKRARSATAPTVRVVEPRAGARVGAKQMVTVRWRATDKDREPLQAKVFYSTDGGRDWQIVSSGTTRSYVALPSTLFAGSKRARIRVSVSDGFNERSAVSGIFTAVARKPTVRITSPARRQRFQGDAAIYLAGEAYDDRGTVLRGKRLTWYDGKRRIGVGEALGVSGLRPGSRILRLRADDGRGGVANAFVRMQIEAARPHLLSLKAPAFVRTSARTAALRVATTVPATLQVGRQSFQVGPKPKPISVRVTPGRQRLELVLRLSARGRTNTVTLVIRRR